MKRKLYAERDSDELEPYRMQHVMAMTTEDLRSKAAIADELAYRDKRIADLEQALREISLCSLSSMSSKEECGRIARKALEQNNDQQ